MFFNAAVGDVTITVTPNTAVAGLLEMSSSIIDFIVGNPLLLLMFSGSLVGAACYVVRTVKKTAKA